jgi:hypothetical protein
VAHAGLPTKFSRHGYAHEAKKCYLTWDELQQPHAWQPPAPKASLMRQKDVFVARCLRYSNTVSLLHPHIKAGGQVNHIHRDQQKTRAAVQIPIVAMLQEILDKYRDEGKKHNGFEEPWKARDEKSHREALVANIGQG